MPKSTAKFISYDLRPAKQSERMMLVDLLKIGGDCGLPIGSYRYVGMGANRFYDFLLMHRYLGIADMVSLEHNTGMFKRACFNVPYGFIDVLKRSSADFISTDESAASTIYWLDYDGGMGAHVMSDVISLSARMKTGDFCFVTVFGGPPGAIDGFKDEDRLMWLRDRLGGVAGDILLTDVENSTFFRAVHKILVATFRNAFAPRRDGIFVPLLQVRYSDSAPMVSVGGAFLTDNVADTYCAQVKSRLPFLSTSSPDPYNITSLYLTERERALFDRAVTERGKPSPERNLLQKIGFKDSEIDAYKDLVRYLPRYVETIV